MSGIDQNKDSFIQHLQEQNKKLKQELDEQKGLNAEWYELSQVQRNERDAAVKERDRLQKHFDGWNDTTAEWAEDARELQAERDQALESVKMAMEALDSVDRVHDFNIVRETLEKLKERHKL